MFSKKLGFALGAVMLFLAAVAFIIGRPPHRDPRIYPLVREYSPYRIEKALGGLQILNKEDPKFKEEPDAVDFYRRLRSLERQWAQKHLRLDGNTLKIFGSKGEMLKAIPLQSDDERRFVQEYYGVGR